MFADADDMARLTTHQLAILRVSLCLLLLHIGIAVVAVAQTGSLEVQAVRIDNLADRVRSLEDVRADARLRVVESDMVEVKWLSRGVTAAIIGHLVATILGISVRRRSS